MRSLFEKFFKRALKTVHDLGGFRNFVLHTAFALSFTSALSYVLGLVRDKSLAYTFGASSELDVYNAAFVVPDFFLALLVTGALSAAFIPIFSHFDEEHREKAIFYTNQILTFGLLFLSIACVGFALFLPYLADWLVPGFTAFQQDQYVTLTRLMLFSPFLFTISNTFGNVLLSIKAFFWYGMAPVLYNLGIIIGVFVFVPPFGLMGLVMGTILGAFLHLLVRLPSMIRYGFRPRFVFSIDAELKKTFFLMLPKMLQLGMWQFMLWWFVRLASQLEEGSVTIYSFARNFQSLPVSLIGIAVSLSAFATLSRLASKKDFAVFKRVLREKSFYIFGTTFLAAFVLALLSPLLIQILLGGGKFDATAVAATASLLVVYCFSVPFESLMHLLSRAHYALKNTLRPSLIHVGTIGLTLATSFYLLGEIGLYAIPVGFAAGLVVQNVLLGISMRELLKDS